MSDPTSNPRSQGSVHLPAVLLVSIGAVIVAAAASMVTAAQTNIETAGVVRIERTFTEEWHYGCHGGDTCHPGGPLGFPAVSVVSPASEPTVDVVATVTMDYLTGPGDYGIVEMRMRPAGSPEETMRPGRFRLNSSGVLTTTTLSWALRDVTAAGTEYEFRLLLLPRYEDIPDFHFRGHRFTVVIELWSPG